MPVITIIVTCKSKDASDLDFVEGLGDTTGGHANDLYIEAGQYRPQIKGGVLMN